MRNKSDGTAFEVEFKKAIEKHYYTQRLYTTRTGYSGVSYPADYFILGQRFSYVELKETSADSFSLTSMEQYTDVKKFAEDLNKYWLSGKTLRWAQYILIVHFLKRNVYVLANIIDIQRLVSQRKQLRFDTEHVLKFYTLEDLVEEEGLF